MGKVQPVTRKPQGLILLLLRCALVGLLAFALARPVVEALQGTLPGSKVAAVVVIDNSASMGTVEGERTRLDKTFPLLLLIKLAI